MALITNEMDPRLANVIPEDGYRHPVTDGFLFAALSFRVADPPGVGGDLCHLAFRNIQCGSCRIGGGKRD